MGNNKQLIITKLYPPKLGTEAIVRPRLLRAFAENPNWRGAFITAPAGYGKTIFMIQAVKSIKQPLVWYQLEAYDNDPAMFLQYLTVGFEEHIPGLEAKMAAVINNPGVVIREKTTVFINEVTKRSGKGFVLVLDDFHVITNPQTRDLVLDLLHYLPNVRFLISSRTPLSATFSSVLENREYLKYRVADLKFDSQEIALLMARNKVRLSDTALADFEQKTGGWATALCLLSIASNIDAGPLADLNSEELYKYLFTEVFAQLPPETREFLKATSVLEDFSPEFCDRFLKRNDSNRFLKYLLSQQLFLVPLNGPQEAYRYHQLFRQFLLERIEPDEKNKLLQRAGDSAKQDGDPNRAIDYYLFAGLYEEAIRLIAEVREQIFVEDCWRRASRWLALIPEEKLTNPWLALLKAMTEYNQGTTVEAEKWVNRAIEYFKLEKQKEGLALAISYKATISFTQGRYLESLKLIKPKIIKNPASSQDVFNVWSYAMLYAIGRLDLAISLLVKKLKKAELKGNKYTIYQLIEDLCTMYYAKGDYNKALEMHEKLLRISNDIGMGNYYIHNIPIVTIYRDWGQLDRAFEMVKESIAIKEKLNYIVALPYAYYELANIHMDWGELKQAEKYYRHSIQIVKENRGEHFFMVLSLVFLALCLSLQGRLVEASSTVEEALDKTRGRMSYVQAISRGLGAPILIQSGREEEGLKMLRQAIKTFTKVGAKYPLCFCHGCLAGFLLKENKKNLLALKSARKCLQLAAGSDFIQMFLTFRRQLEPALRVGLELGIEVSFIQKVLSRIGQPALELLLDLVGHPDPKVRFRVAPVLAGLDGAKAKKALQMLMKDENPEVRDFTGRFFFGTTQDANLETDANVSTLQIQTLGPLIVSVSGEETQPLSLPVKKSRDLLAFLTHEEKPVSRERIVDELWPNSDYQKGISLFHNTLFHLRQALSFNKNIIIYQNGEYQLAPGSFTSDRPRFKETLSKINELDREAAEQLEEILLLYRGDYLEELDYAWLISEREDLRQMYLDARLKLAKYYLETQEYLKDIKHLQKLVEANPFSEEFNSLLMTAYAEIGDRLAVKRCFEAFRNELRDELGVDPSVEFRKLYYRLCDPEK